MAEISGPMPMAPHGNSGAYLVHAKDVGFNFEKFVMPFVIPILSSLIGAAASYTAIRKDIQLNQERVAKLESNRVLTEQKMNDLVTEIAVVKVQMEALTAPKRRR